MIIITIMIIILFACRHPSSISLRSQGSSRAWSNGLLRPFYMLRGFYFVRVVKLYGEFILPNGTILGVTFGTGRGGQKVTPKIVTFSVSVLAVVASEVETPIRVRRKSSCGNNPRVEGLVGFPSLWGN